MKHNSELLNQMLFFELCDDDCECREQCERIEWRCDECGENLLLNENYKVCPRCGLCADADYVQTFGEKWFCNKRSVYKQINHFKHVLSFIQNRETKTVPTHILESLEEHMEHLEVNLENIRKVLKDMGCAKYYKQSVQIYCHLNCITVFECLTPSEEDRIIQLFKKVQKSFNALRDTKRKNFINYNYLVAKLLVKIGREDLAQLCKPLKKTALKGHNKLWGRLCEISPELL